MASATASNALEKRLALHLGGYQSRAKNLRQKILDAATALDKEVAELDAFRTLQVAEQDALPRRLEALREEVRFVKRREADAQEGFRRKREELEMLRG